MTTDNKTLADVQPGGRVRLGDGLQLANEWRHVFDGDGHDMAGANKNTLRRFIQAIDALSAQSSSGETIPPEMRLGSPDYLDYLDTEPSPGGHGDERTINKIARGLLAAQMVGHAKHVFTVVGDDGIGVTCGEAVRAIEAALAARQPVGEPVALGETDPIPCAWSDDDASSLVTLRDALRRIIAGTTTKDAAHFLKQPGQRRMTIKDVQEVAAAHLPYVESLVHRSQGYAAPPAQAVDLGQFRPAVELMEWQERGHANPDFPVGDPKKHSEALRLLALIDSQAGK